MCKDIKYPEEVRRDSNRRSLKTLSPAGKKAIYEIEIEPLINKAIVMSQFYGIKLEIKPVFGKGS